jgi:glycerophosphoryl diester phosphodiesterase
MKVWKPLGLGIAGVAVTLSLTNASWIAPKPKGQLILVARRGVGPAISQEVLAKGGCTATRIAPPPEDNLYIENSLPSLFRAVRLGAGAIEVDVQRTRDNQVVLFRDTMLECRTNGHGAVRDHDLASLKALDTGYGYTADDGRTFPLRGRGIGGMATVEEALREVPTTQLIFNLPSGDPAIADALVAAFGRAGVTISAKHGFHGDPTAVARIKALAPAAWTFSVREPGPCLPDYFRTGWASVVPASCRDTTVIVPVDGQFALWGWPNRFLARMAGAGSRVMVVASQSGGAITGLETVEQIDDVPRSFRGHLWIEDFFTVGRAVQR